MRVAIGVPESEVFGSVHDTSPSTAAAQPRAVVRVIVGMLALAYFSSTSMLLSVTGID